MCVMEPAIAFGIPHNVELNDETRIDGAKPGNGVETEVAGVDQEVCDVEQKTAPASRAQLVQEIRLLQVPSWIKLHGDILHQHGCAATFTNLQHVAGQDIEHGARARDRI